MIRRVFLIIFIFIFAFTNIASASNKREKLQDKATQLEEAVDSLEKLIQKKEEILFKYKNDRALRKSFVENNIDPQNKIDDLNRDLESLHKDLDQKQAELNKTYEQLKPESQSDGHYHPKQQSPRLKYPFKTNP